MEQYQDMILKISTPGSSDHVKNDFFLFFANAITLCNKLQLSKDQARYQGREIGEKSDRL